jgi:hypothetical protein
MKGPFFRGRGCPIYGKPWLLAALVVLAPALGGCHHADSGAKDLSISTEITPRPVRSGRNTVAIRLADHAGKSVEHAHIQVEGDMAHPGMAPVFSEAVEKGSGRYEAPADFTMGGDWVLLLHIRLTDGRKAEHQVDVRGVQ